MEQLLKALEDTGFATAIREGELYFPWLESIHVVAIVLVVGSISIVDMRLMGLPAHRKSVRKLMKDVLPLTWVAFALALATGFLMFASRATDYAVLWQFWFKMGLIALAGLNMVYFHIVTFRSVHLWDELSETPRGAKAAGLLSLSMWVGVVVLGRWLGFVLH